MAYFVKYKNGQMSNISQLFQNRLLKCQFICILPSPPLSIVLSDIQLIKSISTSWMQNILQDNSTLLYLHQTPFSSISYALPTLLCSFYPSILCPRLLKLRRRMPISPNEVIVSVVLVHVIWIENTHHAHLY